MTKRIFFTSFYSLLLCFSVYLMWHTLGYKDGQILVSGKYWSDFSAALPLIRSFSVGDNFPISHPLFSGEPIRYHYLFYFTVGLLEKLGLRLDFALNVLSSLSFFGLLISIGLISQKLFKSHFASVAAIIMFLFNGSLSWVDFLKKYPPTKLVSLSEFPSFGPWNGSDIAAFWNLNTYTNQRHLSLSFLITICIIYLLHNKKNVYLVAALFIVLVPTNLAAASISGLYIFVSFLSHRTNRKPLLLSFLAGAPLIVFLKLTMNTQFVPSLHYSYLQVNPHTIITFIKYWFRNFGFFTLTVPLAFILAPKKSRWIIVPTIVLFILANTVQLSPDIINNHKFLNFFMIIGCIFTSGILSKIKPLLVIFPLLILGGVVDIFPVINDHSYQISDYKIDPDANFIYANTPRNSTILNSAWLYDPASIAGRKIFNGYSYFTWSYGYDQVARENLTKQIYSARTKITACYLLTKNNINFVEISSRSENFLNINLPIWDEEFTYVYKNPLTGYRLIDVSKDCK